MGFSLVAVSGVYCLDAVHRLLISVSSLVVEHGSRVHRLQELWHMGSIVAPLWL